MEIVEPDLPQFDPTAPAEPIDYNDRVWAGQELPLGAPPLEGDYIGPPTGEPPLEGGSPTRPARGITFDFNAIVVNSKEEFERLPPAHQEILRLDKLGVRFTGEQAAQFVMDYEARGKAKTGDVPTGYEMRTDSEDGGKVMAPIPGSPAAREIALQNENRIALIDESRRLQGVLSELENHPGFEGAIGASSVLNFIPFTDQRAAASFFEQLRGGVFLEGFQKLKGGGAITEIEGKKAEDALARLNTFGLKDEDVKKALADLREVFQTSENRMTETNRQLGIEVPAKAPNERPAEVQQLPREKYLKGVKFILNEKGNYVRAN